MAVAVSIVNPPTAEPVSQTEAKDHLRITGTDDDSYVSSLITAARYRVESYTGQRLFDTELDIFYTSVPTSRVLILPVAPVNSVSAVEVNGSALTAGTGYTTQLIAGETASPSYVVLSAVPTLNPGYSLRIRCVAGYAREVTDSQTMITTVEGTVPPGLKQAVLVTLAGMYESRQDWVQGGMPGTYMHTMMAEYLLDPYILQWAI